MYHFNFATTADYTQATFVPLTLDGVGQRSIPVPACWICGKAVARFTVDEKTVPGFVLLTALCHGGRERAEVPLSYFTEPGWRFEHRLAFAPEQARDPSRQQQVRVRLIIIR